MLNWEKEVNMYLLNYQKDSSKPVDTTGYIGTYLALRMAERNKYIDFSMVRNAFDFGAGTGGPTSALISFLPEDAVIDVAEINPARAAAMIHFQIIPRERVYPDGISFLLEQNKKGFSYDLITAFMFGPDHDGLFFSQFSKAAAGTLSGSGQIILTSDRYTLENVMSYCRGQGVDFSVNKGEMELSTTSGRYSTLHIPAKSLSQQPPRLQPKLKLHI